MAEQQKKAKQPPDPYVQRGKELTAQVQRLRGWIGSDPSRLPELVDALLELGEHRLAGHAYAAAGADAQDAVKRSAELMLSKGPVGPYTTAEDAARCGTALIQLAAVQVELGLVEGAEQALESWQGLRRQVAAVELVPPLDAVTVVRALVAAGRVALARGAVDRANAYADAGLARLAEAGRRDDAGYLALDADRLAADARWAAGRPEESLGFLHTALGAVSVDRLAESTRLGPAVVERLAEPAYVVHRDLADRLRDTDEVDLALATRRAAVELLVAPAKRAPELRSALSGAWRDLAADLQRTSRADEADAARAEATRLGEPLDLPRVERGAGRVDWAALTDEEAYGTATAAADAHRAETEAWLQAERAEAHRLEEERQAAARVAAEQRAAREAEEARRDAEEAEVRRVAAEAEARAEAERRAAAEQAEADERKRRREERLREHRLEVERREAEERAAEHERLRAQLAALEATGGSEGEADRLRYALGELDLVDDAAADRETTEGLAAEVVPEPEPEPEPAPEPEPEPEPKLEPEPEPVPDALEVARQAVRDARDAGERRQTRATLEQLADTLRPRAEVELTSYGLELQAVLEELASLRLRGGDLFGSRSASREAKAIGKSMGR